MVLLRAGFYVVIVHLHDEDVLDRLRVTAGRATIGIEARFNSIDPKTARGTRLDFTAAAARERPEAFSDTLADLLKR